VHSGVADIASRIEYVCRKDLGEILNFLECRSFRGRDLRLDGEPGCSKEQQQVQL
jgi:hypothetical protein